MHVLSVLCHHRTDSLSHALADRFAAGCREAGHSVEIADLHAEGFCPVWQPEDDAQFDDAPMPSDVLAEQARIERCDAMALIFPLWWWGMPAMLKGWVDRVWSWGWAYDQTDDPTRSLLRDRTCVMLIPAGASPQTMAPYGYETAMDAIWRTGTLGYFGMVEKRIHILHGSGGSVARRQGHLDTAHRAGLTIGDPAVED
ncbi:MAG: NAD(P)H-dependent oxidoreductase [Pseudomonadota bacterium]